MTCPDCGAQMKLSDPHTGVYWCTPCKRARDGVHMEPIMVPPAAPAFIISDERPRRPDGRKCWGTKYSSAHRHYDRWRRIIERCYYRKCRKFSRYGGRGIYVCAAWHDPPTFLRWCDETYQDGLTIDRINNDGPYSAENCRWVSMREQCRNRDHYTPKNIEKYRLLVENRMKKAKNNSEKETP